MSDILYFAETNHRNNFKKFGIKQTDRFSHSYIIGKTGTGKTTLLKAMLLQDIETTRGCALLDPHGDLVDELYESLSEEQKNNVVYVKPFDESNKFGYNPLKSVASQYRPIVASGLLDTLKKQFDGRSWGARLEHILRNVILTLLEYGNSNFSHIPKILLDKSFRNKILKLIENEDLLSFWNDEYAKYNHFQISMVVSPILNKIGVYLTNPIIKKVVVEPEKEISFSDIMDNNKVLLVNLSKGRIGSDASNILGALFITTLSLSAYFRARIPEHSRIPFFIYADEFQNFTTQSIADMLSELRKYKVGLILANQFINQLEVRIRDSVLGNVGTLISFRCGISDAKYLKDEFYPVFGMKDIISLPNYKVYLKLMIDGAPSRPFSANTLKKGIDNM